MNGTGCLSKIGPFEVVFFKICRYAKPTCAYFKRTLMLNNVFEFTSTFALMEHKKVKQIYIPFFLNNPSTFYLSLVSKKNKTFNVV